MKKRILIPLLCLCVALLLAGGLALLIHSGLSLADALGVTVDALMGGSSYYYDEETASVAQELFENPDLRILFDAARGSRPEDLRTAAALLRRFKEGGSDA